jgi:long-chain acyl-CoA synthetase
MVSASPNERAWRAHYDAQTPRSLEPYPDQTLLDLLRIAARESPTAAAVRCDGAEVSYRKLEESSRALAAALSELGVRAGERVAVLMPNGPRAVEAVFGAWAAGAIAVPLDPHDSADGLLAALAEARCRSALVQAAFYGKLQSIRDEAGLETIVASAAEALPASRRLLNRLSHPAAAERPDLDSRDLWLSDLLHRFAKAASPREAPTADDDAVLLLSGGTTGSPKVAVGTHRAVLSSGLQLQTWLSSQLLPVQDALLSDLPLFCVSGLNGALATALVNRSPLALLPEPGDAASLLQVLESKRPALLASTPGRFAELLHHPRVRSDEVRFDSLKLALSVGGTLPAETKRHFEQLAGVRLLESYSLTESMFAATLPPLEGADKPGSAGLPLPDVELRIVDEEGRGELGAGEVGALLMRAPQLMRGYWRRPKETTHVLRGGWLYTGDLGCLDEDGYLFVVGRDKEVLKVDGLQVWPREVARALSTHPAVAQATISSVVDEERGEQVKALVLLRPGAAATPEELKAHCRGLLAGYKVPSLVEIRSAPARPVPSRSAPPSSPRAPHS